MKIPELSPLTLLTTGAITGIIGTLVFSPHTPSIPEGWGDVIGSICGVFGAFYVARSTFKLENKRHVEQKFKPLLSQCELMTASSQFIISAMEILLPKLEEMADTYADTLESGLERDVTLLAMKFKSGNWETEDQIKLEEIRLKFQPTIQKAAEAAISNEFDIPRTKLNLISEALHEIQTTYKHLLEADEIVWLNSFKSELARVAKRLQGAEEVFNKVFAWDPTEFAIPPKTIQIGFVGSLRSVDNLMKKSQPHLYTIENRIRQSIK